MIDCNQKMYFMGNWNKLMYTRIARHEVWLIWSKQNIFHQGLKNCIKRDLLKRFAKNRYEWNTSIIIQIFPYSREETHLKHKNWQHIWSCAWLELKATTNFEINYSSKFFAVTVLFVVRLELSVAVHCYLKNLSK